MPEYRSIGKQNKKRMPAGTGGTIRRKNRRPLLTVILNALIVFLAVLFLIAGYTYLRARNEERGMLYFGDRYILRQVERHEYAQLVENYYYDHADFMEVPAPYREAAAVAAYADAAFRYGGYAAQGDAGAAERQKEAMDRARQEISLYLPELERIGRMAGLERD